MCLNPFASATQSVDLYVVPRTVDSGWPYHNDLSALGATAKDWQSLSVDYASSKLLSGVMALDVAHQFWYGMLFWCGRPTSRLLT